MSYNEIKNIDQQINELENKKYQIKQNIKKEAVKQGWFSLLQTEFESSSERTPEYLQFHRLFKREFTKLLKQEFSISKIEIFKPNHFDAGGFFQLTNGNIYYFHIDDLRWDKTFLIRTAESFQDYSGGSNDYCNTEDYESFLTELRRIVK